MTFSKAMIVPSVVVLLLSLLVGSSTAQSPTPAPTLECPHDYPYCNPCGPGMMVGDNDKVINIPTKGSFTCEVLERRSRDGCVAPGNCRALQVFTSGNRCGCVPKTPRPTPVPTESPAPSVAPSKSPSTSLTPSATPSAEPSMTPTMAPTTESPTFSPSELPTSAPMLLGAGAAGGGLPARTPAPNNGSSNNNNSLFPLRPGRGGHLRGHLRGVEEQP